MSYQPATSGIEVRLRFFPLAFLFVLFKPALELDGGQPVRVGWGVTQIPVTPGRHQVVAYCPYLFFRRMGESAIVLDVVPGQVVQATWSAPWLAFLQGRWTSPTAAAAPASAHVSAQHMPMQQTPPQPAVTAAAPAGWHPDPTGRHQHRYWDGRAWTANVATNGTTATDPI